MKRSWIVLACLACLLVAMPVMAQDTEPGKDHPLVPRFPGYVMTVCEELEFGGFDFDAPNNTLIKAEGRYWRISYVKKEDVKSPGGVAVGRNYRNAVVNKGGKILCDQLENGGGTFSGVLTSTGGQKVYLQANIGGNGDYYDLYIVEVAGMDQKLELLATELAKALNERGSVAVHGILFDTAKATIKPESAAALAPIGELLKTSPDLKLEIQGHTDNVGQVAANLKLSQERAAAVKDYLVKNFGIEAARLTTAGFGDTKPVDDNKTDAGRAENRRVELVKK
jgi:outer membrane protein OmpA-like peptidoglycan-associated protein